MYHAPVDTAYIRVGSITTHERTVREWRGRQDLLPRAASALNTTAEASSLQDKTNRLSEGMSLNRSQRATARYLGRLQTIPNHDVDYMYPGSTFKGGTITLDNKF